MAEFEILGTVVERGTQKGVPNLRVEAWDRDVRFHSMLGCVTTDGAGQFRIRFTDEYFGDFGGDLLPDIFYRVYRDDTLILSTQDQVSENVQPGRIRVVLEIEPLQEPHARADRVDTDTAIKALTFVRESDFRGIAPDSMIAAGFRSWDWAPVRPKDVRHSDVVGQDTQLAQTKLAAMNIQVDHVEPYDPKPGRAGGRMLTTVPPTLSPGDRLVLYEENGRVKYYAKVRDAPAASIEQEDVARLSEEVAAVRTEVGEVATLRSEVSELRTASDQQRTETTGRIDEVRTRVDELAELRAAVAQLRTEVDQRNQTIATLQSELTTVKEAQTQIQDSDLPQRLGRLEGDVRRLRPGG